MFPYNKRQNKTVFEAAEEEFRSTNKTIMQVVKEFFVPDRVPGNGIDAAYAFLYNVWKAYDVRSFYDENGRFITAASIKYKDVYSQDREKTVYIDWEV